MRQILVNHAKAAQRQKRGAGAAKVELDEAALISPGEPKVILDLHDALERLAALDWRKAQVVELSYFGGLRHDEIAEVLKGFDRDRSPRLGVCKSVAVQRIAQRSVNMTPRFETVEKIFHAALDYAPDDLGAFLDERCGGNKILRGKVEDLLAAHRVAGEFIETPVGDT